jgi:hypothetical protein
VFCSLEKGGRKPFINAQSSGKTDTAAEFASYFLC